MIYFDLPPKARANAPELEVEHFPFVVVRPKNGTDSIQGGDQNAVAFMEIVIGTYSDTDDGGIDVLTVIDAIRDDLAAAPVLERTAFEHIGPLSWEVPAQQLRPEWHGFITTQWQLPRSRRVEARDPQE